MKFGLLVAIFLVLVAVGETAEIHGTVSDSQGKVIEGAKVTLAETPRTAPRREEATTGHDGTYTITGLEIGRYTVTATAPSGKLSLRQVVVIRSASLSSQLDFKLPAEPASPPGR